MSRSMIDLRRLLLGLSCVAMLGFGATQALADVGQAQAPTCGPCQVTGYVYILHEDCLECYSTAAYCDGKSTTPICWP